MRKHSGDGANKWGYFHLRKRESVIVCGWMRDKNTSDINKSNFQGVYAGFKVHVE